MSMDAAKVGTVGKRPLVLLIGRRFHGVSGSAFVVVVIICGSIGD